MMKKTYLLMLACVMATKLLAQSAADDYALKQPMEFRLWDESRQDVAAGTTLYRAQRGDVFTLMRTRSVTINGTAVQGWGVIFWKFKYERTPLTQALGYAAGADPNIVLIDSRYNYREFFISNADLTANATNDFVRPRGIAKLDAFILPFKMRFKNKQPGGVSELTQSINVGPAATFNINYGGPFSRNTYGIIVALNATNITVDEKTVPGVVSGKTTLLGLSPTVGFNYQHNSISFGVFSGFDVLFGDAAAKWAYRKSPWLAISFGTSITDLTTPKKSNAAD